MHKDTTQLGLAAHKNFQLHYFPLLLNEVSGFVLHRVRRKQEFIAQKKTYPML